MCFDVPKVVRSPGFDHRHDKESRNGRDMKIDILEAYIWISEVFRVKLGFYRSTGKLREFVLGLNGPYGKGEKGLKGWPLPSPWTGPNWTREGGRPPFLLGQVYIVLEPVGSARLTFGDDR